MVICQTVAVFIRAQMPSDDAWLVCIPTPFPLDAACKKKKKKVAQQSTSRFILGLCSMIQHLSGCNKAAEHLSAGGDQLGHYICPGIESGQQGEWFLKPALSSSSLTNLISRNAASQRSRRKTSPSLVRKHQKTDQGAAGACRTPFCWHASATKPLFH